ncbi:trans-aconitate 2-methyltransferase [Aureimonas flava]|uniref:Trans-aconitate 2-methyltransferase n=1 Tax=Aureimonas flava TaxID=2320271 RepID=A0A3A1WKK1_9HYPH|nr:trans-aconitate 2-methyltransferase [Aureimonas flava]RIY00001.1 trans-aconitate 2-methyltransferase [Aureimonas flava]
MADWNPALYTRFEDERTRPARDLLARCRIGEGAGAGLRIADLGCGPGNSTALLAERFPEAEIIGFDTSDAMLEAARARLPDARFERADIAAFAPDTPFDLVFSNAALQWVRGHARLVPALFAHVRAGGLLAVQIPDNLADPSQVAMRDIAGEAPFASALGGMDEAREAIAPRETYYDWLAGAASELDVWTTIYNHPMGSPQAITDWFASTGLKPFVDPLDEAGRARFRARYTQEMDRRYPARADGRRLLAFPRLFFVARRA